MITARILPEVLAARRRGVWFDVGNGRPANMRWDNIEKIMKAGFWPDTFSTDGYQRPHDGRDRHAELHVEIFRLTA